MKSHALTVLAAEGQQARTEVVVNIIRGRRRRPSVLRRRGRVTIVLTKRYLTMWGSDPQQEWDLTHLLILRSTRTTIEERVATGFAAAGMALLVLPAIQLALTLLVPRIGFQLSQVSVRQAIPLGMILMIAALSLTRYGVWQSSVQARERALTLGHHEPGPARSRFQSLGRAPRALVRLAAMAAAAAAMWFAVPAVFFLALTLVFRDPDSVALVDSPMLRSFAAIAALVAALAVDDPLSRMLPLTGQTRRSTEPDGSSRI